MQKAFFPQKAIGTLGSYSSFLGFLLFATILAYRQIFDHVFDLAQKGLPSSLIYPVFVIVMVISTLIFIVVPSIPIVKEITVKFREKNRRMAWMLIFLVFVYDIALTFQFIYAYLDKVAAISI